jgi:preprotein translocase subunit SecD
MTLKEVLVLLAILMFLTGKTLADPASPTTRPGTMEFHILADNITANAADLKAMEARLQPGGEGPVFQPGDTIRWFEVEHAEEFDRPDQPPETCQWNGKHYLPVLDSPDASMTTESANWGMENARAETMADGSRAVEFKFDNAGRKLFGDLTTHWFNVARQRTDVPYPHSRLAIVLDNKIISASTLLCGITGGSGIITGAGKGGFTDQELDSLINSINRGSSPTLSEPPTATRPAGAAN